MLIPFQTPSEIDTALRRVVAHLKEDGLIAYPTETVYGLGTRATPAGIEAVGQLKERDSDKPLLILISELSMAARLGLEVRVEAARLAGAFWPGALTMVLPLGDAVLPAGVVNPNGGVAVRQSSHPATVALVSALDAPLISTSANRSRGVPLADGIAVEREFSGHADLMVLDGGSLPASLPSTVIDLCGRAPVLIREGAVSWSEVKKALAR